MTDHIVSFSVGIDDDKIVDNIQKNAEKQVIRDIRQKVMDEIFANRWSYKKSAIKFDVHDNIVVDYDAELTDFAKDVIKEAFNDCREEIIKQAAKELADSFKRTKVWKEAAAKALEEGDAE